MPLKLAVLPDSSKLTVALLVTKLALILAVFVLKAWLLVMLFANKFPPTSNTLVKKALLPLILALLEILAVACIDPPTVKFDPILAILPILKLLAVTLPLLNVFQVRLLNVASPIFGVVKFALVLTVMLPATIAVVSKSTFAEMIVPLIYIPLPAVYPPDAPNWAKVMLLVPKCISPGGFVNTYDVPAAVVPCVTKKYEPEPSWVSLLGAYELPSLERVNTQFVEPVPTVVTSYIPFCVWLVCPWTSTRWPTVIKILSIVNATCAPAFVRVAPTPASPNAGCVSPVAFVSVVIWVPK